MNKPIIVAIDCPNCNKKAQISEFVKEIPNFGKTLISTLHCNECGFKMNDVMAAEFHEPKAFSVRIEKPIDLRTKIIRNSCCAIKIRELGVEVEPGPVSEGYISNIESLLEKIEMAAKTAIDGMEDDESKSEALKAFEMIKKAKNAAFPFTVELFDPYGNSGIIGKNVIETKLSEEQIKKLTKNMHFIDLRT